MFIIKKLILGGIAVACLSGPGIGQDAPLLRWGTELAKSDPAPADQLKKLSTEITDFKNRLQQMEDSLAQQNTALKSQFQSMQEKLSALQTGCDRLQKDGLMGKTGHVVQQASATEPGTKKTVEDTPLSKADAIKQDTARILDEITAARQEVSKLNLQVQANSRDLLDLKKKYDALQLEFIQAQNDIGKLQQDFVRWSTRSDSARNATDAGSGTDRNRQSLALPLPPDAQANAAARSTQGVLKLTNNYPLNITVIVDGQYYSIRPNDSLTFSRSPGYVNYEVLGIQGNTVRTINAGETLTVQVVAR